MSPGPATDLRLCPHMQRLDQWHQEGFCHLRVPSSKTQEQCAGTERSSGSATQSTLRVRAPTPKPPRRQQSFLRSLKTVSDPENVGLHAGQAAFFPGLGGLSPWPPASRFLGWLGSRSFEDSGSSRNNLQPFMSTAVASKDEDPTRKC